MRIADGRRHVDDADLAHACRRIVGRYDLGVDFRQVAHPQYRIVVEVRLLDGAALHRELLEQRRGKAVHHRAFQLRMDVIRLDHQARIDGDPVIVDLDLAGRLVDRHLGDARGRACRGSRRRRCPCRDPCRFCLKSDISATALITALRARLVLGQFQPDRQRILAGGIRDLVEEGLGRELVVARADAAPGMHAHAADFAHILGLYVRDRVERLIEAARADVVLAAGRLEARRRGDRIDVLRHQPVIPAGEVALGVEAGLHARDTSSAADAPRRCRPRGSGSASPASW